MFYLQLENKSTNFRHLKDKKCNRPVWYWLFPLSLIKLKTTINHPLYYFPLSTKPVDQRTALRTTLHQCSPISELPPPQVSFRTAPPARSGVDLVKVKWLMETLRSLIPGENPKGMRHVATAVAAARSASERPDRGPDGRAVMLQLLWRRLASFSGRSDLW